MAKNPASALRSEAIDAQLATLFTPEELALAALPGAMEVDPELMREAIADLNYLAVRASLQAALNIGECVVRWFGAGDLDGFHSGASRHLTWRELRHHGDKLKVTHSYLWFCVAVLHEVRRVLPPELAESLSITQHRRLRVIKDPVKRTALARRAVEENLTTRQLAAEVKVVKAEEGGGSTGRKSDTPGAEAVKGVTRALATVKKQIEAGALTAADADALLQALDAARAQLLPLTSAT